MPDAGTGTNASQPMSAASRRKGLSGERDVARALKSAGWHVSGLESGGDHFAVRNQEQDGEGGTFGGQVLHVEVKRQERLRIPEWLAQAANEAPPGVPAVVVFRQNRTEWHAVLPLADLLGLIG